jgi:hypothetical protein
LYGIVAWGGIGVILYAALKWIKSQWNTLFMERRIR